MEGVLLDQEHGEPVALVELADGARRSAAPGAARGRATARRAAAGAAGSSARAPIASICCSPPESVPPRWLMRRSQPREQREHPLEVARRNGRGSATVAPICRFSSTVMRGKMRRPSGDCAMRSLAISCVGSRGDVAAVEADAPSRARGLPNIVIISVDLPAPLAPIRVTISPSLHVEVDALQRDDVAVEGLDARAARAAVRSGCDCERRPPPRPRSTSSSSTPR